MSATVPSPTLEHGSEPPEALAPAGDVLPRKFGRYTLLRRRAVGGMAELDVASQGGTDGFEKTVVIKRVLPAVGGTGDRAGLARMVLHEGRRMAAPSQPKRLS